MDQTNTQGLLIFSPSFQIPNKKDTQNEQNEQPSTQNQTNYNQIEEEVEFPDHDYNQQDLQEFNNQIQNIDFNQNGVEQDGLSNEIRKVPVPPNRLNPLKKNWEKIVKTIVETMKLQIRMNTKKKCVELRNSPVTTERTALQRSADFIKCFMLGFDLNDAVALLRLDDLYVESFEIKDVKNLQGDHLSRCIGRISGEKGKTRYAIENATRTRIVLADQRVHILGSFNNIRAARDAICALILGSPPGKVYSQLKSISRRYAEKF